MEAVGVKAVGVKWVGVEAVGVEAVGVEAVCTVVVVTGAEEMDQWLAHLLSQWTKFSSQNPQGSPQPSVTLVLGPYVF